MLNYEKKYVELLNGETFAYIEKGRRNTETVVLLHGNMASSVSMLPLVDGICETVHVFAPDLRGFGDSSYNNEFRTMKEIAQDVFLFCAALGIERAHFAGWSTCAPVALELAVMQPRLVKSVISIDGVSHRGHYMFPRDGEGKPITDSPFSSYAEMSADPVLDSIDKMYADRDFEAMKKIWNSLIYNVNRPNGDDYAVYLEENSKERCQKNINWAWSLENMSDTPTVYARGDGSIHNVKCPVSLIVGDVDYIKYQTMEIYADMPEAQLVELPNCGHSPFVDCPELLSRAVLRHIENAE